MPDISMCSGKGCSIKDTCYRCKATPSSWQSYFLSPPKNEDGTCEYFMEIRDKPKPIG